MLGALIGEAVAAGAPAGAGAAIVGTPPVAIPMAAIVVAAEGGWSMRGTLRIWAMHHDVSEALPGIGPWSVQGDGYVPDACDGAPSFRPWAAHMPWLAADPVPRASALMSLVHHPAGAHHQAGVAVAALVEARLAGAPASAAGAVLSRHPALVAGGPFAAALLDGAAAGWVPGFDAAMRRLAEVPDSPWRPLAGFVAGIVAQAGVRSTLPGWCHAAALGMDEDVLVALGLFERLAAAMPPPQAWAGDPPTPSTNPAPLAIGLAGRVLARVRSGVVAFAAGAHPSIGGS